MCPLHALLRRGIIDDGFGMAKRWGADGLYASGHPNRPASTTPQDYPMRVSAGISPKTLPSEF